MINNVRPYYENLLLSHPNGTLLFLIVFFVCLIFLFFYGIFFVIRLFRSVDKAGKQMARIHGGRTILFGRFIVSIQVFLRMIDTIEQRAMRRIHTIVAAVSREICIPENDHER